MRVRECRKKAWLKSNILFRKVDRCRMQERIVHIISTHHIASEHTFGTVGDADIDRRSLRVAVVPVSVPEYQKE